jgi:hypothetical protein
MRFFRLESDGDPTASQALDVIQDALMAAGAQQAILVVRDEEGVSIAHATAPGADDSVKTLSDLMLEVALDMKDLAA